VGILWGDDTQLNQVPRPPGAPGQRQRRGAPGRTWSRCELQRCRHFLRGHNAVPDHWHVRVVLPPACPAS